MSKWNKNLTMYTEQWNNSNGENVYMHQNRNPNANINQPEGLQNHQQYIVSHQQLPEVYSSSTQYNNGDNMGQRNNTKPCSSNGNNYNPGTYGRPNPNYNMNYPSADVNNVQTLDSELYNDQFLLNAPDSEHFNRNMDQYSFAHYSTMYNPMKHRTCIQRIVEDELQLPPEQMLTQPPITEQVLHPVMTSNGDSVPSTPKSQLIDNLLGNWTSNPSGTYTPFGHTFLNVQPNLLLQRENVPQNPRHANMRPTERVSPNVSVDPEMLRQNDVFKKQDSDNIVFQDSGVSAKKRIIAEVKPMRPSYSAVLSKTPRNNNTSENKKKDTTNKDFTKSNLKINGSKQEKLKSQSVSSDKSVFNEEKTKKSDVDKKTFLSSQISSGSENGEANEINAKTTKGKGKNDQSHRKYISLDDLMKDDDTQFLEEKPGYNNCDSEFVFLTQPEVTSRKKANKKMDGAKQKTVKQENSSDPVNDNGGENCQDPSAESDKLKKKSKEMKSSSSSRKILAEKNKKNSQNRNKKPKHASYLGKVQNLFDRWLILMKNVLLWFYNLLSDIFRMSAQLSFDFASSSFKTTHGWVSKVCSSVKDKIVSPQWLLNFVGYIDRQIGHTWVGFWRHLKFLNIMKYVDENNTQKQTNTNIPLPATGDDAMKRLLACKGKDPYSILGVGTQCSDEDIKRYYRRQAFLVHPDKNQQPGAEEAFKILQHAFDLIGVPGRREAYDRKLVESAQMEAAFSEVAELLAQLQDKVKHAAGTIRCTNCCRRHVRTITSRPAYAARYCQQCKIRHAAKEGDIWAESQFWGLLWKYYACMDGAVYQITQWASCQKKNLKHLVANTHHVQYRIVLGNTKSSPNSSASAGPKQNFSSTSHDANLEDFLNNLYSKASQSPGETRNANPTASTGETNKTRRKAKKMQNLGGK